MSPERVELRKLAFDRSFYLDHVYIQVNFVIFLVGKESRHITVGFAIASRQGTLFREVDYRDAMSQALIFMRTNRALLVLIKKIADSSTL